MKCVFLVLAAGKGERMKAKTHKVLHKVCGRPMIDYILETVSAVSEEKPIVIISHEKQQVMDHLGDRVIYVEQDPKDGWGTAMPVKASRKHIEEHGECLVFTTFGDTPFLTPESLNMLKNAVLDGADAALLSCVVDDPFKLGRILRDENGNVSRIVEEKDCTEEQKKIKEINCGYFCFRASALLGVIDLIQPNNAKGEYYLTDTIELLNKQGKTVKAIISSDPTEGQGINDKADLAKANEIMRQRINHKLMLEGVEMIDPKTTYIEPTVKIEAGVTIYPGSVIEGNTVIKSGAVLRGNCRITDSQIGENTTVESSVLIEASVGCDTTIGPNAYLRPGTVVGDNCRVGDFVEIKNSTIGSGTKISHLTYVGDATLGERINLGCGVVFVNYDGKNKQRVSVGDDSFIGCNVNLVAPLNIGKRVYIAAGSTVTKDIEDGALCIARERETVKPGWVWDRIEKGLLK